MGTSNSKHRTRGTGKTRGEGSSIEENFSWRDMDGPSFYCAYLGFSPLSKPPTNLSVLQTPVKELYYKYRKTPASGRSASLKLTQQGVVVVLYEDGVIKAELFFDFASVIFVDATKFSPVKSSSERKPKALFAPVDEAQGAVSDKNAFLVEKSYHFLISSTHPPLVVCVVRRPAGVKALDCHVFALDTTENALHIAGLISSTQMPSSPMGPGADVIRTKGGNFDRGTRGDVIRTDHGEYSVYRGPQSYEPPPPSHRYSGGQPLPGPGRNGQMGGPPPGMMQAPPPGGMPGPIILTQDIFREPPSPNQQHFGGAPGPGGYGMYEQQTAFGGGGGPGGQYLRQPDVIMQARQRSADSLEQAAHDRSFSGSDLSAGGVRMRYEEVNMRTNSATRTSGGPPMPMPRPTSGPAPASRLSGGQGGIAPRPQDLPPSSHLSGPQHPPWQVDRTPSPASPLAGIISPRSPPVFSPTSPRGFDQRAGNGPVFSASNLESRGREEEPEEAPQSGRPVAKVPPHMKAGIKVLPSDFRAVKLKPKAEKKSDTSDDGYDNNKEIMDKYKELQEYERDFRDAGTYPDGDGFKDFSDPNRNRYHDDRDKDFMSQWNDNVKEHRALRHEEIHTGYRQVGGLKDFPYRSEDNNNKNRLSAPPYGDADDSRNWGSGQKSHSAYSMGGPAGGEARVKDLEIADMFSNFTLQGGNNAGHHSPRDRSEIEAGLGYLP